MKPNHIFLSVLCFFLLVSVSFGAGLVNYPKFQGFDSDGNLLVGGYVETYVPGTSTEKATYSDKALTAANENPVDLDSRGEALIYVTGATDLTLYDIDGVLINTFSSIDGQFFLAPVAFLSEYATLLAAVTDLGVTETELWIDTDDTMSGDVTTLATTALRFIQGNTITTTGHTLTINGSFSTGLYKVFNGTGSVVFGDGAVKEVYPEWWTTNTVPGTTDMSAAIISAINSTDNPVIITDENLISPDLDVVSYGVNRKTCFNIKNNMHLRGIPGKSILKIKDNASTDASPLFFYFFYTAASIHDVSFDGITFDSNGVNNPISPGRPGAYNTYHQSAILAGSDLGTAKIDNLTVNNCVFLTSPGTNPVAVAEIISDNVKITNNYFIDNGWDTSDHTTVLLLAKNSEVSGNVFTLPNLAIPAQHAIDIHGPHNIVRNNIIHDYITGISVVQNENNEDVHAVDVHDNIIDVKLFGIWLARFSSGVFDYYDISVHDNIINVTDTLDTIAPDAAGITLIPDLSISKVYIYNNVISKLGGTAYPAYGIVLFPTAVATISELYIQDNKMDLFTQGISLPGFVTNGTVDDLHIKDNIITHCTTSITPVLASYGIVLSPQAGSGSGLASAYVVGNTLIGINSADTGVFFGGIIDEIDYRGNYVRGYAFDYVESGLTNTTYYGEPGVILLAEVNVALNGAGTTTLYTVPAFRTCILDHATITTSADAGNSVVSIGGEAATYADFIPNSTLTNLNLANTVGILVPIASTTPVKQILYPGGRLIVMKVTTALGAATNKVRLYGYLY